FFLYRVEDGGPLFISSSPPLPHPRRGAPPPAGPAAVRHHRLPPDPPAPGCFVVLGGGGGGGGAARRARLRRSPAAWGHGVVARRTASRPSPMTSTRESGRASSIWRHGTRSAIWSSMRRRRQA